MKYNTFYILFLTLLVGCYYQPPTVDWQVVGTEKTVGISGIAALDKTHFLVVHDNKKAHEPRVSLLSWSQDTPPHLQDMTGCRLPFTIDLEGIVALPSVSNTFLLLESQGRLTRIRVDGKQCDVLAQFALPNATAHSNIESVAIFQGALHTVLVWAERGDDERPAQMSWGTFDVQNNHVSLSEGNTMAFFAPYPNAHRRSISDMAIDEQGKLWVSAVSDPGDNGVFHSALYNLGQFVEDKAGEHWVVHDAWPIAAQYDNVKIEGLTFVGGRLLMGTDDENFGSKVAVATSARLSF